MSWMVSVWAAGALLALCVGGAPAHTGLSSSGFHLCVRNTTRTVSFLAVHKEPFSVTEPCGGWLLWRTCTATAYRLSHRTEYRTVTQQEAACCHGYVQVGQYCALPADGGADLCPKPGSCPAPDGPGPGARGCHWDLDCPGWQKCCQRGNQSVCSDPAWPPDYLEDGRNRFNATVTVKADYNQLVSQDGGLLNHTRLLQAMVVGVLQSNVSLHYLASWPVDPYRTATALLVAFDLPLSSLTSKLQLLLRHIEEVSSVTVEDMDECAVPSLHRCPPAAACNNTPGSYRCVCHQGYFDADPGNPGAGCEAEDGTSVNTELPFTSPPPTSAARSSASKPVSDSTEHGPTPAPALSSSAHVPPGSPPASTTEPRLPTTACSPPSILRLWSTRVTGSSFSVCWSSHNQTHHTYHVVIHKGPEVLRVGETSETMVAVLGLDPGVLYSVTVTPRGCGCQGSPVNIRVRTDVLTLGATARLTNIQFTAVLLDASSHAYKNLTESIIAEIYQALSPELKALWDSEQVRVEIRRFSPGSVVANLTIVFTPSQSQDISDVSAAIQHSLINSTKYTVDADGVDLTDFNECASGDNDCSPWATCTNTWASYTCGCLPGFKDGDPGRPGRACEADSTTVSPPTPSTDNPPSGHSTPARVTDVTTVTASAVSAITSSAAADVPLLSTAAVPTSNTTTPNTTTSETSPKTTNPDTITPETTTPSAPQTTTPETTTPQTTTLETTAPSAPQTTTPQTTTLETTTPSAPDISPETTTLETTTPQTTAPSPPQTTTPSAPQTVTPTSTTPQTTAPPLTTTPQTTAPPLTTTPQTTTPQTTTPQTTASQTTAPPQTTTPETTTPETLSTGAISVRCRGAAITVSVTREFLLRSSIREASLHLGLPECGVNGDNETHVQLTVGWTECDTRLAQNESHYMASVTLFNSMDQFVLPSGEVEAPKVHLEVPVTCSYLKNMLISADFSSMGYEMLKDVIVGSGSFLVKVQLMNGSVPLPHNYSLSSDEAVVVEVSLNTSLDQIKVVIHKCWATPTQDPGDSYSYIFLENSCPLNTYTKVLTNGNSSTSRLSVQIFSLVDLSIIYLHCQVQICAQLGSDSCVADCFQRTSRSSDNMIATGFGSTGPLLKSSEENIEDDYNALQVIGLSCLGVGLCLCFIIAFVCLFYYQRNRIGHYNFSANPKEENFSSLVVDTQTDLSNDPCSTSASIKP